MLLCCSAFFLSGRVVSPLCWWILSHGFLREENITKNFDLFERSLWNTGLGFTEVYVLTLMTKRILKDIAPMNWFFKFSFYPAIHPSLLCWMSQEQEHLDDYRLEEAGYLAKWPFPEKHTFWSMDVKGELCFLSLALDFRYWTNEISHCFGV